MYNPILLIALHGCTANPSKTPGDSGNAGDTDTECSITSTPSLNSWTPTYEPQTDCSCPAGGPSCHAIYQGRADALTGNFADLSFQKTTETPPSTDVSYWVVVGEATEPSCTDLDAFVTRSSGTWSSANAVLAVAGVSIWPSDAEFHAAPAGETKNLFIITGGSDGPDSRTWFQKETLVFSKECP